MKPAVLRPQALRDQQGEVRYYRKEGGTRVAAKLADFVILDENPRRVDPERIKDIAVLETWMDGKQVFSA